MLKILIHNLWIKRVAFALLPFFCLHVSAQEITITNKSNSPIDVEYLQKKIKVENNGKKIISEKEIVNVYIYSKDIGAGRNINLFLEANENLEIGVSKENKFFFKGKKDSLHNYINFKLPNFLYSNVKTYQSYSINQNAKGLINFTELQLSDIFSKVKSLGVNIWEPNNEMSNYVKSYITDYWLYVILMSTNSEKINNFEKEIFSHYYNKYLKKNIASYSCNSYTQYAIIEHFSRNKKALGIELPKYDIVEKSEEDHINQYMCKSCQKFYFSSKYNYLNYKKVPTAEYYRKVLKEKFGD